MNKEMIEKASKDYINCLIKKQTYYCISKYDLGQMERFVESFTHYLVYLEEQSKK